LTTRFQRYYQLNREITIDERMIKYTGRLSFLQYIQNKPTPWGIKVFVLADAKNGYVWNWKVYTGREIGRQNNVAQNTVIELTQPITGRGHILFHDSYFSYFETVRYLATQDIGTVGTLYQRRRNISNEIRRPTVNLATGASLFRRFGNVVALLFKDRKEIRVITNIYGKEFNDNDVPIALVEYNKYARGVDLGNQMVSTYRYDHRTLKWYKTLAYSFIETSIVNALILYKLRNPLVHITHLNFREILTMELLQSYIDEIGNLALVRQERRIIPDLHKINMRKGKACAICSTKINPKTVKYYCETCDVHLCPVRCFFIYHHNLVIYSRKKERNLLGYAGEDEDNNNV